MRCARSFAHWQAPTSISYFIVFSSSRTTGPARFGARLFVTPIVVENGTNKTYGALYLWNQPDTEDNHSPSWEELQIPPVGPPKQFAALEKSRRFYEINWLKNEEALRGAPPRSR